METQICQICNRPLGSKDTISKHHLVPKSRGGKDSELITIHNICHQKIHSVFTTRELENQYNTVEQLVAHEEMKKFIKWVAKRDPDYYQRNRRMKNKGY